MKKNYKTESMETNNSTNVKKYFLIIIGIVIVVIAFFATRHFLSSSTADSVSTEEALVNTATEMNKNYPMMVDGETKLDNVMSLPNNTFQHSYTLVNVSLIEVLDNLESMRETLKSGLITDLKNNPDLKVFMENKTTMVYYYNDRDGNSILEITITPDLYQ
ncbi:MAG: hypothetical protein ACJAV5_001313 [Vicingaceae bacterium]|jgi:hypothetical protein